MGGTVVAEPVVPHGVRFLIDLPADQGAVRDQDLAPDGAPVREPEPPVVERLGAGSASPSVSAGG